MFGTRVGLKCACSGAAGRVEEDGGFVAALTNDEKDDEEGAGVRVHEVPMEDEVKFGDGEVCCSSLDDLEFTLVFVLRPLRLHISKVNAFKLFIVM